MPLTTTSGYTFPIAGVPTTQNPGSGTSYCSSGGSSDKSYSSFNGDWMAYLQYMADHGDQSALDKLLNYLMSERSATIARDWTARREDSAYQRLVADMKAAGINPYALLQNVGSPIASSSSGHSYSGSGLSSYDIQNKKIEQNWLKIALSSMLPIIGAVIAAAL